MDAESGIRRWSQGLGDERSRDQAASLDELVEEETCKLSLERCARGVKGHWCFWREVGGGGSVGEAKRPT